MNPTRAVGMSQQSELHRTVVGPTFEAGSHSASANFESWPELNTRGFWKGQSLVTSEFKCLNVTFTHAQRKHGRKNADSGVQIGRSGPAGSLNMTLVLKIVHLRYHKNSLGDPTSWPQTKVWPWGWTVPRTRWELEKSGHWLLSSRQKSIRKSCQIWGLSTCPKSTRTHKWVKRLASSVWSWLLQWRHLSLNPQHLCRNSQGSATWRHLGSMPKHHRLSQKAIAAKPQIQFIWLI